MKRDIRVGDFEVALHSIRPHYLYNISCTTPMVLESLLLVQLRHAAHESHVVHLDRVLNDHEDGIIGIRPETFTLGWLNTLQVVPGVAHGEFLCQRGVLGPGGEIDDLLAVEVDDTEVFALLDFKSVAMGGRYDVRFWMRVRLEWLDVLCLREYHDDGK